MAFTWIKLFCFWRDGEMVGTQGHTNVIPVSWGLMFEANKRSRSRLKAKTQDAGGWCAPWGSRFSPIFLNKKQNTCMKMIERNIPVRWDHGLWSSRHLEVFQLVWPLTRQCASWAYPVSACEFASCHKIGRVIGQWATSEIALFSKDHPEKYQFCK